MGLIAINKVVRKDSPIHYRRAYKGVAVVDVGGMRSEARVDFVLEMSPLGTHSVDVFLFDKIDYSEDALKAELKSAIERLDEKKKLP
ncbi:MAG: hypothetical protein LBC53_00920 [Spirochaetaceae bacterium]|jgi:hypothetical protein|nr:hypothetical protein [Spirochaetaceae bacterium]